MADPTLAPDTTSKTPGIGRPAATRSYACFVKCRNVMGDDHPPLDRRPLQNSEVVCSGEPDVLDADDVEVGLPAEQSSNYVAVEVLVRRESQHESARC